MPRTTIAFLGQCQTSGYPGVPPELTFPQVCRRTIEASRPGTRLHILHEQYYHPSELSGAVGKVLARRPRIVVVEVVGWLAIIGRGAVDLSRLPGGVRTVYDRLRHFRHASQLIVSRMPGLAPDAVERYRAVEQMARRVAAARKALYVDRWSTVAAGFFLPGSIRPGSEGHAVWGHLLAQELMAAGLV